MEAIQDSMLDLQRMFTQRMDAYQCELQAAATAPSSDISSLSAEFSTFRKIIMAALQSLHDQVTLLARVTDNMEMRSRRKMLILHGVPEDKTEDTSEVIIRTVVGQLKLSNFSAQDISRCHRMGRLSGPDKPRPILFKVRDLNLRNNVWGAKTNLKGSGITLSEFLTKSRHDTFMAARRKFGVNKSWTRGGFVYVIGADGARHRITYVAELEKIPVSEQSLQPAVKESTVATRSQRAGAASKKKK